ncbi:hypothetical protein P8452_51622 [Trifolium repens]|nr:hypothetical protein P8452_51622 [Trifolium repens]
MISHCFVEPSDSIDLPFLCVLVFLKRWMYLILQQPQLVIRRLVFQLYFCGFKDSSSGVWSRYACILFWS